MPDYLMHEEALSQLPFTGGYISQRLADRVNEVVHSVRDLVDPSISVVIRSRNNADQLKELLRDIDQQNFDGNVEVIIVDTESTDDTLEVAKKFGAKIIPIKQQDFNYPKALNLGFSACSNDWILTLVDHSRLSHNQIFKIATRFASQPKVVAISGITLPKAHATWTERIGAAIIFPSRVRKPAISATTARLGFLPANASVIDRTAWSKVGGFDERYAAGGEDTALAQTLLKAGYKIISDPALAVYHSHGVGPIHGLRQLLYWASLGKPQPFDRNRLESYRKDLQ